MNTNLGLLLLRLGFSGMMLTHGVPKLLQLIQGDMGFPDPLGIGGGFSLVLTVIGEAICPILIILGIKTRWMAIPPAITMLVAALIVHASDPIGKKELALLYAFAFIGIALLGGGKFALKK